MTEVRWQRPTRAITKKSWWTNTITGQNKRAAEKPIGDEWMRGFTKK
jgi:hypothetical protein